MSQWILLLVHSDPLAEIVLERMSSSQGDYTNRANRKSVNSNDDRNGLLSIRGARIEQQDDKEDAEADGRAGKADPDAKVMLSSNAGKYSQNAGARKDRPGEHNGMHIGERGCSANDCDACLNDDPKPNPEGSAVERLACYFKRNFRCAIGIVEIFKSHWSCSH